MESPQTPQDRPKWCNLNCEKMALLLYSRDRIDIAGSAAMLYIKPEGDHPDTYIVDWKMTHSLGETSGYVLVTSENLRQMFDLAAPLTPDESQWMLNDYGGTCAWEGVFIRQGQFLNIPGPGTGHDGDPNLSVCITADMKAAVTEMLEFAPA